MKTKLTAADWQEIYYAVDSKLHNLPPALPLSGPWSEEQRLKMQRHDMAQTRNWARHLKSILRKLGPDAENMTKREG